LTRYQAKSRACTKAKLLLKPGNAPMAVPGTSRHNLGLACDYANMNGPTFEFMCEHGPRFVGH